MHKKIRQVTDTVHGSIYNYLANIGDCLDEVLPETSCSKANITEMIHAAVGNGRMNYLIHTMKQDIVKTQMTLIYTLC
jgi:hypothetical protein